MKKYFFILFILFIVSLNQTSAQTAGTLKWKYKTSGMINWSTPAISADGTIYIGSCDGKLYALKKDGTLKWTFSTGDDIFSSPAIGLDGTIYVGSRDGRLYAVNSTGSKKWEFATGDDICSSPTIGLDGTIYIGSDDDNLYAINPNGTKKWIYSTGGDIFSSPAISPDGAIYFGSEDNKLHAINLDGSLRWTFSTDDWIGSSPAIAMDGTIYVGCHDDNLYAINQDGSKKWAYYVGKNIRSSPVIGTDGTIYIAADDNNIYAINPNGSKKWAFSTGYWNPSSPTVGNDGTIYVGSEDDKFYAINPNGTQKWVFKADWNIASSAAIGSDGTLYFGSWDTYVYAVYCNSNGLAQSSWPKFHQNEKNTGTHLNVTVANFIHFSLYKAGETPTITLKLTNPTNNSITLTGLTFDSNVYTLTNSQYVTIQANSSSNVSVKINPGGTKLYRTNCLLKYKKDTQNMAISEELMTGLFLEDESELTYVARQAISGYNSSYVKNPGSIATQNNLGVLFRLLNETDLAKNTLMKALSRSINAAYGFAGIKMNVGVVYSDEESSSAAKSYYSSAGSDVSSNESQSALSPKIDYNEAWEFYKTQDYAKARTAIHKTINHQKTGRFLKAKAYVLRGAIYHSEGDFDLALSDFQSAVDLDPTGPIGAIAQENIRIATNIQDFDDDILPEDFILLPNYPNPFNPQTTISFGLPENCKISLRIYNVLGQVVRTLINDYRTAGWHSISWNGIDDQNSAVTSGIYILELQTDNFKSTRKITLMR